MSSLVSGSVAEYSSLLIPGVPSNMCGGLNNVGNNISFNLTEIKTCGRNLEYLKKTHRGPGAHAHSELSCCEMTSPYPGRIYCPTDNPPFNWTKRSQTISTFTRFQVEGVHISPLEQNFTVHHQSIDHVPLVAHIPELGYHCPNLSLNPTRALLTVKFSQLAF